jgi:hypothetical protein
MSPTIFWLKITAASIFFLLGLLGLFGHLSKEKRGFQKLPAYKSTYGEKWGPILHFLKVAVFPILISGLLVLSTLGR